ncbi:lipoprotein [Spiroplasma poulsonii]|uniref:lipoprotein n=2 Tax=Spiroplasma TaxID=2132 RepID=UPI001F4CB455|nr:lipoprotein [Spiroplasma poulsonii]UNF62414.1 lipoprotein [Spiroplasma poulsonii]
MKKIIGILGTITMIVTPVTTVISCNQQERHYVPTRNTDMEADISQFLSQFTLQAFNDEGDYWVKHDNDDLIFTTFNKEKEAHTLAPIINYDFNNSEAVSAFELPKQNILFKTYLVAMPSKLPPLEQLYRDFQLFSLIRNTTAYSYTKGETTMQEITIDGEHLTTKIYYLTINLNSNVFWNYEINKDLLSYLINYIQTNPSFIFSQNMTDEAIITRWLTAVYTDSNNFKISNIKTIKNISALTAYLTDKLNFQFNNLDTKQIGKQGEFNFNVSDQKNNYRWQLNQLKYEIR